MTNEELINLIQNFRRINTPDAISPELLGSILRLIVGRTPVSADSSADSSLCTVTLTLDDGSEVSAVIRPASGTAAGIIRAGQFLKYESASVNGKNAIEWLNEFKAKTAEDFSDVYTMMQDYADSEDFYYFKQSTEHDIELLDRKVDTLTALHDRDIAQARKALFDDLFIFTVGSMGQISESHCNDDGTPSPYCLNKLWLTYEEALAVYAAGAISSRSCGHFYEYRNIRTNLPPAVMGCLTNADDTAFDCARLCDNSSIEVLNLNTYRGMNPSVSNSFFMIDPVVMKRSASISMIGNCPMLKEVTGIINLQRLTGDIGRRIIGDCPVLTDIWLTYLKGSIDLSGAPKLNVTSVDRLVEDARNTGEITVKVDQEVYAKLTGDVSSPFLIETPVAELERWRNIMAAATAKNIRFQSPGRNLVFSAPGGVGANSQLSGSSVIFNKDADSYFWLRAACGLDTFVVGETYTFSLDCSGMKAGNTWRLGVAVPGVMNMNLVNGRCSASFVMTSELKAKIIQDNHITFDDEARSLPGGPGEVVLSNFKLERGDVATEWSMAPEEILQGGKTLLMENDDIDINVNQDDLNQNEEIL